MWKLLYCLAGDLDTNVVEADSNVGRVDESSIGGGDTMGGGLGNGGHGDGVGGDSGGSDGVVGVGQGSNSGSVDESGVSLSISGPLAIGIPGVAVVESSSVGGDDSLDSVDSGGGHSGDSGSVGDGGGSHGVGVGQGSGNSVSVGSGQGSGNMGSGVEDSGVSLGLSRPLAVVAIRIGVGSIGSVSSIGPVST